MSMGMMFEDPASVSEAEDRAFFEPLVEIHQVKGTSECRIGLGTTDEDCGFELTVMTYNIHHGAGADKKIDLNRIAAVIQGESPDIVALQEVDCRTRRSGGVDSSVAAALMLEQGADVIGVTLKQWEGPDGSMPVSGCCTLSDAEDARRVAAQLDIPYYVLDYVDDGHQPEDETAQGGNR